MKLTEPQQEFLMRAALDEAKRGVAEGEAPIGCVIARGEGDALRIVARGHNQGNTRQQPTAHAEIMAFANAASHNGQPPALPPDADDAILVSTLEPCVMCLGAAMEGGIKTVLFGLKAPADNGATRVKPPESPESSNPEIIGGILAQESRRLFAEWLRGKEETKQAEFVKQLLALTPEDA